MKVLVVYNYDSANTNLFVKTLVDAIRHQGVYVDCSVDFFWKERFDCEYDVIHIQWPEEFFYWGDFDEKALVALRDRFLFFKESGCKIVYTRHNSVPHYSSEKLKELYSIVETNCDGIVHMGRYSLEDYKMKYHNEIYHKIIFHHVYDQVYSQRIPKEDARRMLGISSNKKVILSFGKFRHKDEIKMVLSTFLRFRMRGKFLLAPRMLPFEKRPRNYKFINRFFSIFGYYILYPLSKKFNMKLGLEEQLVKDEELPIYFSASDIVLIQRKNILNSGNIPMAFLFQNVVVGPDCGNISELLRLTGNPIFDPKHLASITDALRQSFILEQDGKGVENYDFAIRNWNTDRISKEYISFYQKVLAR